MGDLLATWYGKLLVLLGIAAAAGVMYAASGGNKVSAQISDITMLQGSARQQLGETPNGYMNFTTGNAAYLIQNGIVPPGMVRSGNLVNKWGGAITLAPTNNNGQAVITLAGINNQKDCGQLLTTLRDYDTLVVGGTTFTRNALPDGVSAAQVCSNNTTVVITFS